MDLAVHQITKRGVDQALPGDARLAGELGALDLQGEVRLAAAVVAGMSLMPLAFVDQRQDGRGQRQFETAAHFGRDRSGGRSVHDDYIAGFAR